jgi:hypothetical protein
VRLPEIVEKRQAEAEIHIFAEQAGLTVFYLLNIEAD